LEPALDAPVILLATMASWQLLLLTVGVIAALWGASVLFLVMAGRRADAGALARLIPDCLVLFRRLLGDPRVPRRRKLALAALLGYVAIPVDIVPDFIPVAGQLDDAIIVALVLRGVLRGGGDGLLREHWPGPDSSLELVVRFAARRGAAA
jgi:uncharacterized membrane protein YkvA (DUF1232 family)